MGALESSQRRVVAVGATAAAIAAYLAWLQRRQQLRCAVRDLDQETCGHRPKQYVAKRGTPATIDGDVFKEVWRAVPWSEPFQEIRGDDAPPETGPTESQATRMKMLWDDEFLYIAAIMDVAAGDELVAKFTERNSAIFHTDSDFEVFLDPTGCCHGYKELEMNPINTVWNLMLNKPYSNGGGEFSGRVAKPGDANHYDVHRQRTAARVLRGALHDPSQPAQWCCEVAMAHSDTLASTTLEGSVPAIGDFWRINFSRVEKKGAVNWVWSPQVVWSPNAGRFQGEVNMHLPDAWGSVVFANATGKLADASQAADWVDPAWPARQAAMCVYYAARAFENQNQRNAISIDELNHHGLLTGMPSYCQVSLEPADKGFAAKAVGNGWEVRVLSDRWTDVRRL